MARIGPNAGAWNSLAALRQRTRPVACACWLVAHHWNGRVTLALGKIWLRNKDLIRAAGCQIESYFEHIPSVHREFVKSLDEKGNTGPHSQRSWKIVA